MPTNRQHPLPVFLWSPEPRFPASEAREEGCRRPLLKKRFVSGVLFLLSFPAGGSNIFPAYVEGRKKEEVE